MKFSKCRTQSFVGQGAGAPGWSALPPAFASPLRLWPAAMLSWNLRRFAILEEEGAGQGVARGFAAAAAAGSGPSTAEEVPDQWKALEVVVHAILAPKPVAGQNSWLPGVAGHGKSQTWTGWAGYDFGEWQVVICAKSPDTSRGGTVARYLVASEDHGSTCSRSELA